MDFFQSQEDARRRTRRLLWLFALSVTAIIVLLYVVARIISGSKGGLIDWPLLGIVAASAGGVIGLGSGFKTMQLAGGGAVVARDLGGRAISPDTTQPDERRLLNVVEEMALASGVPVPAVWIMDGEEGINAFAAGHTPSDAVIGVTRGCLRAMSRDELQGVIAHEFSHILNGDMRLNLRLIGVVHGLLVIAILGRIILRITAEMRGSSSDSKSIDPRFALLFAGAGLLVAGSIGVFFGKLIKAAIARQREYLADAAAVQFTRNPDSIGGALLKIGGYSYGSELKTPRAEEASHLMFSNAMSSGLSSTLDSHPPLEKRIRAILPHWDGTWPTVSLPVIAAANAAAFRKASSRQTQAGDDFETAAMGLASHPASPLSASAKFPPPPPKRATPPTPPPPPPISSATARAALDRMGSPTGEEIESARRIGASIPPEILTLLRDPAGAQAVIMAVLLSKKSCSTGESNPESPESAVLSSLTDPVTTRTVHETAALLSDWHSTQLIAIIDLALPSLRRLTPAEYGRFAHIIEQLTAADGQLDLFEFMLQKLTRRHLDHYFRRPAPTGIRIIRLTDAPDEISTLLSAFAALNGPPGSPAHTQSLNAAAASLSSDGITLSLTSEPAALDRIGTALDRFDAASPAVKKQLLHACAAAALADGQLSSTEAELLRATADTIGCPIPPFVSGALASR
jgi:Zn-dependent protease with chaperone function